MFAKQVVCTPDPKQKSEWSPSTVGGMTPVQLERRVQSEIRSSEKATFEMYFTTHNVNDLLPPNIQATGNCFEDWDGLRYPVGGHFVRHVDTRHSSDHWGTLLFYPPAQWQPEDKRGQKFTAAGFDPETGRGFEGGALVAWPAEGEPQRLEASKLTEWTLVVLPIGVEHAVEPVTQGTRYVFKRELHVKRFFGHTAQTWDLLEEEETPDTREAPYQERPVQIADDPLPEIPLNDARCIRKARKPDLSLEQILTGLDPTHTHILVLQNLYGGFKWMDLDWHYYLFERRKKPEATNPVDRLTGKDRKVFNALVKAGLEFEVTNIADTEMQFGDHTRVVTTSPYTGMTLVGTASETDDDGGYSYYNGEILGYTCLIVPKQQEQTFSEPNPKEKKKAADASEADASEADEADEDEEKKTAKELIIQQLQRVRHSDQEEIEIIADLGPDFVSFEEGRTLFLKAVHAGALGVAQKLLDAGANPAAVDEEGNGARHLAAVQTLRYSSAPKDLQAVYEWVLEHAPSAPTRNFAGKTPFHHLAEDLEDLVDLIPEEDFAAVDEKGQTLLFLACCGSDPDLDTVEEVLTRGIQVNVQDNEGKTVLHHVVSNYTRKVETVELLLRFGVNTSIVDNAGKHPVDYLPNWADHRQEFVRLLTPRVVEATSMDR